MTPRSTTCSRAATATRCTCDISSARVTCGPARRCTELVDGYLSGLPSPVRAVLDYLALAEPLRRNDLAALAGRGRRRPRGSRRRDRRRRRRDGLPGPPALHRPRPRRAGARRRAQALRTSLVEHLTSQPSGHIGDQLRLAALSVGSDSPAAVADTVAAAQHALRLGELDARRTARHARRWTASGGLPARLALAYALAWQGRGREADAALAAVDPEQLSQPELIAWALPRAANQFWMLSEPERATAFLQTIRGHVAAPTRADHPRRAGGDLRDERGHSAAHVADRRRGAGVAARRRGGRGLGGVGGGAELGARRTVRRRRGAGPARDRRRPSRSAAVHQRLRPDHRAGDGRAD